MAVSLQGGVDFHFGPPQATLAYVIRKGLVLANDWSSMAVLDLTLAVSYVLNRPP